MHYWLNFPNAKQKDQIIQELIQGRQFDELTSYAKQNFHCDQSTQEKNHGHAAFRKVVISPGAGTRSRKSGYKAIPLATYAQAEAYSLRVFYDAYSAQLTT